MCIETHPCLFSFLDTIIVLFQSRPRNLPRTTLFRDILNPCSVNGDIMDSRLQRRILNILLHHGVADEIRCPLGPGIEFDAHQGCRNIILKTIIARSGSINQPLLIYRSMWGKKKKNAYPGGAWARETSLPFSVSKCTSDSSGFSDVYDGSGALRSSYSLVQY